jgi:transposase
MQEAQHTCFAGVDVAKETLVIAIEGIPAPAGVKTIQNNARQIRAWLRTLPVGCAVAVEATGGYQDELVKFSHAQGLTVYVLNPLDVHHYAKACAVRGKTDRVDAQVIARYVHKEHARLRPWQPPSQRALRVKALLRERQLIGTALDALGQGLKVHGQAAIRALQQARKQIDTELLAIMRSDPGLRAGHERLQTISGVGPLIGALLADLFAERRFANGDAAVAFSGLDPRPRDSGKCSGRRRLSKRGSPLLRRFLYLAAMAARRTKAFAPVYDKLRLRGLQSTEALVILARKILRIAFSIWNSGQNFKPDLPSGSCAKP